MRKLLVAATLLLCFAAGAHAQENNDVPYVEVVAANTMKVAPDYAMLNIRLNSQEGTKESIDKTERRMYEVLEKLKLDPEKNLRLVTQTSNFVKRRDIAQEKNYTMKVTDLTQLSDLFDQLETANIANVTITSYGRSDIEELRIQNKDIAVKKAKENAERLAQAAGCRIGSPIYIRDNDRYSLYDNEMVVAAPRMMKAAMADVAVEEEALGVSPRDMEIRCDIVIRYLIVL